MWSTSPIPTFESTMADPLLTPFAELCGALRGLQEQVQQLARVHEAVDDFNVAFGGFQGAMAVHASCLSYPKTVPVPPMQTKASPSSGIPVRGTAPNEGGPETKRDGSVNQEQSFKDGTRDPKQGKKIPAASMKRHGKVAPHGLNRKRKKMQAPKNLAAWKWERHVREKIPRKYQSPAELKKLENIVLYLKNRHCAISITDLVKHSGLPVIRCKEILQTLMKLDIVERKREKSGFVYSFDTSN